MSMMHADVALVGLGHQAVEVRQRAVLRIDVLVVGDVVAEIDLRRGIDGREPDRVDAEFLQVVEALGDAVQVADAVAVRVLKAARIDLVDDGVLPPVPFTRMSCVPHFMLWMGALVLRSCGQRRGSQKQSQGTGLDSSQNPVGRVHCNLLNLDFAAERSGNGTTPFKPSHEVYCVSTSRCAELFFMRLKSIPQPLPFGNTYLFRLTPPSGNEDLNGIGLVLA